MFVYKYPHWVGVVVHPDGGRYYFDGAKDLFKYLFAPGRYVRGRKSVKGTAVFVTDYYSVKLIPGRRAWYVIGSDVLGPMGRELIPFKKRADALAFLKDHKGKKVLKFEEVTPCVIKWLDR
ncbi:MAG: nitrous oxide reductase accessory protein NosL [Proteobacteria bacterium]|nr:nitrous oxide reductase accessory protein NosL [Pseudomonadota bacterium]